jgi:hypothetical protein
VSYRVDEDERAQAQVRALPATALTSYGEIRVVLEIAPWSGDSLNNANPDGAVRTATFGPAPEGMVTYLVLEDIRRVDVLDVVWLG